MNMALGFVIFSMKWGALARIWTRLNAVVCYSSQQQGTDFIVFHLIWYGINLARNLCDCDKDDGLFI